MIRSLPALDNVRVVLDQGEVAASVLERKSTALGDGPGAKPGVVALDVAASVTPLVCHSEVDSIG